MTQSPTRRTPALITPALTTPALTTPAPTTPASTQATTPAAAPRRLTTRPSFFSAQNIPAGGSHLPTPTKAVRP